MIEVFRYNAWATLRLIDFCRGVDPSVLDASAPGTFGSIKDTLSHIVRNEEGYASTVEGSSAPPPSPVFTSLDDLYERTRWLGERWERCLDPQPHPDRLVESAWRGERRLIRLGTVLVQVISHGAEHRAHVCTILGSVDMQPPQIDGWAYGDWVIEQRQQQRM